MSQLHQYYVYMLTNKGNAVIYVGVTNDIKNRTLQHKQRLQQGFTKQYGCNKLVYYQAFQWIDDAIVREKQLKGGSRQQKVNLINQENPNWEDLSEGWYN